MKNRSQAYIVSYDGEEYGEPLSQDLGLSRLLLTGGRSAQATLLGREDLAVESLYLSPQISRFPATHNGRS